MQDDHIKLIIKDLTPISFTLFSLTCKRFYNLVKNILCRDLSSLTSYLCPWNLNYADADDSVAFMFEKWFTMKMTKTGSAVQKYLNAKENHNKIVLYPCANSSKKYEELFKTIGKNHIRMNNGNIQLIQFAFVKNIFKTVKETIIEYGYGPFSTTNIYFTGYFEKVCNKEVISPKVIIGTLLPLNNSFMMFVQGITTDIARILTIYELIDWIKGFAKNFTKYHHSIIF